MYPPQPVETNVAAFVPEVLKPHFYRVLFLVGSEVEICKQWLTKKTGLPPKPSEAGSVGRGDTAE